MPRLVGQQSHTETNVAILIIFIAIAGVLLEYFGAIDFVPGFGQEGAYLLQRQPTNESVTEQDN
ncbi:hypothetical protein C7B76_02265 [filamentous cyanobacterium CCP2]|nr:hypothetical protein C7B76_02265 [filamentous cyanobacterium CCP2]